MNCTTSDSKLLLLSSHAIVRPCSLLRCLLVAAIWLTVIGSAQAVVNDAPPIKTERFEVQDRPAFLILPETISPEAPTPWVLYAPTLGKNLPGKAEHWMFRQFLDAGIAIAGVDVGESYGSPKGRATYNALHKQLTQQHNFASQASLLARSRGGLMLYCWAADNPEKVSCIAGIYPVCNIASYPGLKKACGAYSMTEAELTTNLTDHNPIDRLAPLAKAEVPIFHIHGDKDGTVPLEKNSAIVKERYDKLGGDMILEVVEGQGHNMWPGWFESQRLVDFVIGHANDTEAK
jgi:pimeloyl-ACP methyl ester carboxylesterase